MVAKRNLNKAGIFGIQTPQKYLLVHDPRVLEIVNRYGLSVVAAAGILSQIDSGNAVLDDRQTFAKGGMVDDDEAMSYLTKASRLAAPYLDDGEPLRIYTKEEIKDYPKGITQTVYRDLKEGTEIEHLEDFELTDKVGVSVHTYKDKHLAG